MSTMPTSGTKLDTGPVEVLVASSEPSCTPSMLARSSPVLGWIWHLKRALLRFSSSAQKACVPTP